MDLRSRLSGLKKEKHESSKIPDSEDISLIHHRLMLVYGYIPLEEFRLLPFNTLNKLYIYCIKELEKREQLRCATLLSYGLKKDKIIRD